MTFGSEGLPLKHYGEKPTLNEQAGWNNIVKAADQPAEYYRWCHAVLAAHEAGQVTQVEAAGMMCPRQDVRNLDRLEQSADVQIVMDYAADVFDGAAYIGAKDNLDRDWRYISEVVNRHI